MKEVWDGLGRRLGAAARAGLVAGVVVILLLTGMAAYWLLRTDYQVLFSDMTPQDAAAMTAELERQKIPYLLSDEVDGSGKSGATILIDRSDVYKTRIKLMGKEIPLHGAIGFELFNSSDLGMTEFAQKINYQRALQGELARTILSLDEIRDARVLLALPDQGLFKQAANKPKASVALTLKAGRRLRTDQVSGIQRLVSAAVPGILVQDVTLVDQSGVALTRAGGEGADAEAAGGGSGRLDLKKDTENYLSRKATAVLERALGEGQASASVDVTLDMDRVQSNTDELVGAPSKPGGVTTGVVTRERETVHEVGAPLGSAGNAAAGPLGGSNQREVEYALGHRIEQVISQPGSVRRIQVAVVIRKNLPAVQLEQLRVMVAAAVGASTERGDAVVVQSTDGFGAAPEIPAKPGDAPADVADQTAPATTTAASPLTWSSALAWLSDHPGAIGFALLGGFSSVIFLLATGRRGGAKSDRSLTDIERQELLAKLREWMEAPLPDTQLAGVAADRSETREQ